MRYLIAVAVLVVAFIVMCFHWPTPEHKYRLMSDPNWYRLDTRGIER